MQQERLPRMYFIGVSGSFLWNFFPIIVTTLIGRVKTVRLSVEELIPAIATKENELVFVDLACIPNDGWHAYMAKVLDHFPHEQIVCIGSTVEPDEQTGEEKANCTERDVQFVDREQFTPEWIASFCRERAHPRRSVDAVKQDLVLTSAGISLDSGSWTCTVHGTLVKLGTKEFVLLTTLMRNPGILVTDEQLMTLVWPETSQVKSQCIQSCMCRLNRALKKAGARTNGLIKRVQKVGYKWQGKSKTS